MVLIYKETSSILPNGKIISSKIELKVSTDLHFIIYADTLTKKITMTKGWDEHVEFDFDDREFKAFVRKMPKVYRRIPETKEEIFYEKLSMKHEHGQVWLKGCNDGDCDGIRIVRRDMARFMRFRSLLIKASQIRMCNR